MANNVFANGREIACKSGSGKVIAAFPDVCFTPPDKVPPTPPGVPIPYPLTSMATDTDKGTKKVVISKKEVMKKDSSDFKKCNGDNAAQTAKKGLINSKLTGKVYFKAWSMDVKIEKKNAVRHLDVTTSNHASGAANAAVPWPFTDTMTAAQIKDCKKDKQKEEQACSKDGKSRGAKTKYMSAQECCESDDCRKARNCMLVPYGGSGSPNCCDGDTGHHLLPNSLLQNKRGDSSTNVIGLKDSYGVNDGPCVCVDGAGHSEGAHGDLHDLTKSKLRSHMMGDPENGIAPKVLTYTDARDYVSEAHAETFKNEDGSPQCNPECMKAQIDASLKKHRTKAKEIKVRQKDGMTRKNFEKYQNTKKRRMR